MDMIVIKRRWQYVDNYMDFFWWMRHIHSDDDLDFTRHKTFDIRCVLWSWFIIVCMALLTSCKKNKRWIDAGSHNKQLTSGRHSVICRAIFNTLSETDTDWIGRFFTCIHTHRWMLLLLLSDAISLCDKIYICRWYYLEIISKWTSK
jgi:hypothetical protein